jgi:Xaa-Pro aminopeptidase
MVHPYAKRRDQAQRRLRERSARAAIACPGPNLQYFTGFRGEPVDRFYALVLPATGPATLVTPTGYETQARRNATVDDVRTVPANDPEQVAGAICSLLAAGEARAASVLVDHDALYGLTHGLYERLGEERLDSAAPLFDGLRRRKDDAEVAALRRSAELADEVSAEIRSLGAEALGMTEADLATAVRRELHARGATGVSFDVVVGAGPNGADPALRYGDREVRRGEPVVVDFGCFLDGYASDQTRTVVFHGDPPEGFERIHRAVREALDAGVEAAEPGATAGDVDAAARETLDEYGYADRFTHPTGHGVGLASHETLAIAADEPMELEPGMVFSVEPGVYVEDEWGVRIEDLVVVTEEGCEQLNDSPRTWRPL